MWESESIRAGFEQLAQSLQSASADGKIANCAAVTAAIGELRSTCGDACADYELPDICNAGGKWALDEGGNKVIGGNGDGGGEGVR